MQSIIQILKVNEPKTGTSAKTGRAYSLQDCECILMNDDGSVGSVGVLQVPDALKPKVAVGTFTASFALAVNFSSRRVEARLTDLTPVPVSTRRVPPPAA